MTARKRPRPVHDAAPPVGPRAARKAVDTEIRWIFDMAHELTGAHAPWEMDVEREAIDEMRKVVLATLFDLPKTKLLALGRKLHELAEARDFQSDQLESDYMAAESEGRR
jgi:hypothetical protein